MENHHRAIMPYVQDLKGQILSQEFLFWGGGFCILFPGWRSVLYGRDLLKQNLGKVIGDGPTTKVCQDSWISLSSDIKPYRLITEDATDLRVSDLLTSDLKWNKARIEEILPDLTSKILSLRPSQTGVEDAFTWQPLNTGIYSTKSGYHSAMTPNLGNVSHNVNWYKDVWNGKCSPKLKVFIWSILQRALPIGENLQRRGFNSNVRCQWCGRQESATHLFISCPFAQKVWSLLPIGDTTHLAGITSFEAAIAAFHKIICLPPTGLTVNIFPWACWQIWTSRNHLIFENMNFTGEEVALRCIVSAKEWTAAQDTVKLNHQPSIDLRDNRAEVRSSILTSVFTDAAWNKETLCAGLGWVFFNQSEPICKGSEAQDSVSSPLMAEALPCRSCLKHAISIGLLDLRIYSDNQTLIRAINSKLAPKEIFGVLSDIKALAASFSSISFSFTPRSSNLEADSIAKAVLRNPLPALGSPVFLSESLSGL